MTHAADTSVGPHVVGDRLFFKMPDGSSVDPKIGGATAHEIVEMWGVNAKSDGGLWRRPDLDSEQFWAWEMVGFAPGRERLLVRVSKIEPGIRIAPMQESASDE